MSSKKILDEENFEKKRKSYKILSIVFIILGIIIAISFVSLGIVIINNSNEVYNTKVLEIEEDNNKLNTEIETLENENFDLDNEISSLENEKSKVFFTNKDEFYRLDNLKKEKESLLRQNNNKIKNLRSDITSNNSKLFKYEVNESKSKAGGGALIIVGIFSLFFLCSFSSVLRSRANLRDNLEYNIQSIMPIAKKLKEANEGPYKCPNCGSNKFEEDEESGKTYCKYCHTEKK